MASRFWVGGSATWDGTADSKWATSSGGAGGASVPTAADDVFLDGNSGAGTVTMSSASVCRSLNCTGFTGTLSHPAGVTLSIGDGTAGAGNIALKLVSGMTYSRGNSATSALSFVSTSATVQTIESGLKAMGNVTFNGAGGAWKYADNQTITATLTLTAGSLDTNNVSIVCLMFVSTGSAIRSLTLGTTVLTLNTTSATTILNITSSLTISAVNSNIVVGNASANARSMQLAGLIFGTITYTVAGSTGMLTLFNSGGACTIGTLNFSDANNARTLTFQNNRTYNIDNFNVFGGPGRLVNVSSDLSGTAATLSKGSGIVSCDYLSLQDSVATGGATWYAGGHSTNVSGNSGWIFTAAEYPLTVQNALHGQSADAVGNFLYSTILVAQDARQLHVAENVVLPTGWTLAPADTGHLQRADAATVRPHPWFDEGSSEFSTPNPKNWYERNGG